MEIFQNSLSTSRRSSQVIHCFHSKNEKLQKKVQIGKPDFSFGHQNFSTIINISSIDISLVQICVTKKLSKLKSLSKIVFQITKLKYPPLVTSQLKLYKW